MNNNLGRDKLSWRQEIWNRIDQAVHAESQRSRIARRFLPVVPLTEGLTAPADRIEDPTVSPLTIEEGAVVSLTELWVEFALTPKQVEGEENLSTAVTLAMRAANLLAQAEDLLIFQGRAATNPPAPVAPGVLAAPPLNVLQSRRVLHRAAPAGDGLSDRNATVANRLLAVSAIDAAAGKFGENTFAKVAEGYSRLQNEGHYGPYALVLHTDVYADTYAPLANTLIMPADRIKPLVVEGFYGTGTLPANTGLLFSVGGNTVDIVVGTDTITAFVQEDNEGRYRFRVYERMAVRDKDPSGRILLTF